MGKLAQIAADVEMAARLAKGPTLREEDKIKDPDYWTRRAIEVTFFDLQRAADRFAASVTGRETRLTFADEHRLWLLRKQLHDIATAGQTKYASLPVDKWPALKAAE